MNGLRRFENFPYQQWIESRLQKVTEFDGKLRRLGWIEINDFQFNEYIVPLIEKCRI